MSESREQQSIFDLEEFRPYQSRWQRRVQELDLRASYYDGRRYSQVKDHLGWLYGRLSGEIKPLYLPLARAVDVDAGIVPGGWAFPQGAPTAWQRARRAVFDWSGWDTLGVLYVHYGAQYGVSGLRVADLRATGRVVIAPLDPTRFMLVESGQYDETPRLAFYVEDRLDENGEQFEYAEVIAPQRIRTFKDGEPFGFDGRQPAYRNDLGFVPFVEVHHIENGAPLGEATFQKAMPLLDEVNALASDLSKIIDKHAEPQWVVVGAEPSELTHSGEVVWFLPAGADVKALVPGIDIAGVLSFIQEVRDNVHNALPELSFDTLRQKTQIATATLKLQLLELVLKIKRVRPNYDAGLVSALRMAGRAAAGMKLDEVASLDSAGIRLDDRRPVLPLDLETEMRLELQSLALERQRQLRLREGLLE